MLGDCGSRSQDGVRLERELPGERIQGRDEPLRHKGDKPVDFHLTTKEHITHLLDGEKDCGGGPNIAYQKSTG